MWQQQHFREMPCKCFTCGPIPRGLNLLQPDIVPERLAPFEDFVLARNNFQGWLHVWKMEPLPERGYNQGDIYI